MLMETGPIRCIRRGAGEMPTLALAVAGQSLVKWSVGTKDFEILVRPGALIYLDRDYELESLSASGKIRVVKLDLDPHRLEKLTGGGLELRNLPRHILTEDPHVGALMRGVEAEILSGCPSGNLYAESVSLTVVSYFWGRFAVRHSTLPSNGLSSAKLATLKDFLRDNISQDVSLSQLAGLADLSEKHLCRCFKQATGESPYQYVLKLRAEEAKRLLRSGKASISEIALAIGFSTPSHFSTAFRKATGLSPSEFRKNL